MARTVSSRPVEFKFHAPQAKKVSLAGTFNNWNIKKNSAKKDSKGNWNAKLSLKPGRYEYKFVVDGNWLNDPRCSSCVTSALGSQNCVIDVK
jgi:1,4-alpha-glucan branching enzyme